MDEPTQISTLRRLRGDRTRAQVARELGITERTLMRHEDGTTPLSPFHIVVYATYYGVPADTLRQETVA